MKVVFTPSYDEQVAFAAAHQKRYRPRLTSMLSNAFVALNLVLIPAALIFDNRAVFGITAFALNLALYFLLSWQQRRVLRAYYETVWPTLEKNLCEIDLDEEGVSCRHAGNRNFIPWPNVRNIFQNKQLVILDGGHTQILASKRGFATEDDAKAFVTEAKQRSTDSQA
ncbi:MAG: YcxB family protein [Pyrinomonadaceae bacterium]